MLDSPLPSAIGVEQATDLALRAGAELRIVLCLANQDARNLRVAERIARMSQPVAVSTTTGDGRARYRHLPANSLTLKTDRAVEELLPQVLSYIRCGSTHPD